MVKKWLVRIIFAIALLSLIVQLGHFIEHVIQSVAWIGGYQEKAYMTPVGMWFMDQLGLLLFPNEVPARQAKMGFEFLHLIGNTIFLIGTMALAYFIRTKAIFWAFMIETFHLYEHVSLTVSAYFINQSIGFSTFFGMPLEPWTAVAYRVWWHFLFNLIPTMLVSMAIYSWYKGRRKYKRKKAKLK